MRRVTLMWCLAMLIAAQAALPAQTVEVVRDDYWVPHIIGDGLYECAYGLGRVMAEDHPVSVLERVLTVRGTLAAAYGSQYLVSDLLMRGFRVHATADSHYVALPQDVRRYIEGFVAGVNDHFQENPQDIPPEIAAIHPLPITPVDVYALGTLFFFYKEWQTFLEDAAGYIGNPEAFALPEGAGMDLSNQWAIAPSRTADGAVYLLCDPHQMFEGINASYEAHLLIRNLSVDFEGKFPQGVPFPSMGHNRTLAWSFTSNKPDYADAYLVTLDPQNPDAYLIDGQSYPFTVWQEVIQIAGAPDTTFTFRSSPDHGLVIRQLSGTQVLCARLELTGKEPPARQTLAMMQSATVAEFINAMQMHLYARANTVAADVWGNLYYLYGARVHWRNDPRAARQGPLDGSNSQNLWGTEIPFSELPTVLNPAAGYLQNCNDAPWYVTENPGFGRNDVPIELVYEDHFGVRGQRATELILAGGNSIDSTYCRRIALDAKIVQWDSVDTVLQIALQEAWQDSLPRVAYADSLAAGLFNWDGFAHRTSTEMGLFTQWFLQLRDEVDFLNPDSIDYSQRRRMVEELIAAGDSMRALYGTEWVPWADIHGFERGGNWFGLSGGDHKLPTARMGSFDIRNGVRRYRVYGGNNFLMIIRLKAGESPRAWTMKPYGQSQNPASPHYNDLTTLYSLDSLRRTYYEEADFRAHAELIVFYTITGMASGNETAVPREFTLAVAPNPFNPATTVRFSLPQASPTRVVVYNLLGQKVTSLLDRRLPAGHYQVRWEPDGATASGLYFIRLETDFGQRTVRAVLVK